MSCWLTIDTSRLNVEVRVENLDGGTNLFPHIYVESGGVNGQQHDIGPAGVDQVGDGLDLASERAVDVTLLLERPTAG